VTARIPPAPISGDATAGGGAPPADAHPSGGKVARSAESQASLPLRSRRDELAQQVAELHWDLGGLAYEMAIRDQFRLDVLVRRAALLQARDAELAEIERLLRLEESASAGSCPACGAPHSRGALFCWQCGNTLMERARSSVMAAASTESERGDHEDTLVIDAIAAPQSSREGRIADGAAAAALGE
jgi:chorismate mutase